MTRELLSQAEADRLLGEITADSKTLEPVEVSRIWTASSYDFSKPPALSSGFSSTLATICDAAAKAMSISLSTYFQSTVNVSPLAPKQLIFSDIIANVPDPSCIGIVELKPLEGESIMVVDSQVIFTFVDKLMGGSGEALNELRQFTEIEFRVASMILGRLLGDISGGFDRFTQISPAVLRMEDNPEFVNICPASDRVVILPFDIKVGELKGVLSLCIPLNNLDPIRKKLDPDDESENRKVLNRRDSVDLLKNIKTVKLNLSARIGETSIPFIKARTMKEGDVLILERKAGEPIDLFVEDKKRFKAIPGQLNGKKAVKVISAKEGG
ncbi:MAG: hypothetical protein GF417_08530 [Candidatus Latescibacteria bacterium]|nr:hypothetical protein [bacterium]MBD3424467.1 hypothetical protein [Candidatus Latescibacterota bacterium]